MGADGKAVAMSTEPRSVWRAVAGQLFAAAGCCKGWKTSAWGTHGLVWLGINSCWPLQLLGLGFVSEVVEGVGLSWLFAKQERWHHHPQVYTHSWEPVLSFTLPKRSCDPRRGQTSLKNRREHWGISTVRDNLLCSHALIQIANLHKKVCFEINFSKTKEPDFEYMLIKNKTKPSDFSIPSSHLPAPTFTLWQWCSRCDLH